MTTMEFILVNIVIPGLAGGLFAPVLIKGWKRFSEKWSNNANRSNNQAPRFPGRDK